MFLSDDRGLRSTLKKLVGVFRSSSVMDFIISVTGSGAKVVRDAISQRLWPGAGQDSVQVQQPQVRSDHDTHPGHCRAGESDFQHR